MSAVASRDLRNHTAAVLERVQAGETVLVTVHGEPVAQIGPAPTRRRRSLPRGELAQLLATAQADAGLRAALAQLAGDTTDDLEPPR